MQVDIKVEGLEKATDKLNKWLEKKQAANQAAITEAGLFVMSKSMEKSPVITGNLRSSAFIISAGAQSSGLLSQPPSFVDDPNHEEQTADKRQNEYDKVIASASKYTSYAGKNKSVVVVGHTAGYALSVHENPNTGKTKYGSEVGEWKFLEHAITENTQKIKTIIKDRMNGKSSGSVG